MRLSVREIGRNETNQFVGNTLVGAVPSTGLETTWVVRSIDRELRTADSDAKISRNQLAGEVSWIATFALTVPAVGPSMERLIQVADDGTPFVLNVAITSGGRPYRELTIEIDRSETLHRETVIVDAAGANVRPPHEWTTPPYIVSVHVNDERSAFVSAQLSTRSVAADEDWPTQAVFSNHLNALRAAADRWRASQTRALDEIDPDDLEQRLQNPTTSTSWEDSESLADASHEAIWLKASSERPLREMAARGYQLFEILFPQGSERRSVVDELLPGSLISIRWDVSNGAAGGIPWSLLYTKEPAASGPVDGACFLGLRFRVEHIKNKRRNPSIFLGSQTKRRPTSALYWGALEVDVTATQAQWQRGWQEAPIGAFDVVPIKSGGDPKLQVLSAVTGRGDGSAVIYMYCACGVSSTGGQIVLDFAGDGDALTRIEDWELGSNAIPNGPLIFANACDTGRADAYNVNMLEQHFVARGCRAFIGTETKVPIVLASRVALVFFRYFATRVDSKAMHAGEALALTRRFLWLNYRNLGGLLYSYVDQYRLVLADEDEVDTVQRW